MGYFAGLCKIIFCKSYNGWSEIKMKKKLTIKNKKVKQLNINWTDKKNKYIYEISEEKSGKKIGFKSV